MQDVLRQAEEYRLLASQLNLGHYRATERANQRHRWLGVAVVVAAAIVSTSIFATLESTPELGWKIAAGAVSAAATVLAALQTFFRYSDLAALHKEAAARYGAIRRQLDIFLLRYREAAAAERARALDELQQVAKSMSDLARESPYLSRQLYEAGVKEHLRLSAARRGTATEDRLNRQAE